MISIKNLNKTYASGTKAIDQLSLDVSAGEILALLGPNGAGKSSTIRVLTTLSGFDEGTISVANYNIDSQPEKVRQSIGYVAQETGVDYFLTGRENLTLQGHLYRMKRSDIESRIDELGRYFEIDSVLDNLVSSYSGGMKRKLDIATALIHRPQILFLDEPTLGLDTPSRQSLWKYIRKLNDELKLTILLTTHYLEEADKLSDRVAIIHQGQIKTVEKPDKLKDEIRGDVVSLQFRAPENKNSISTHLSKSDFVKDAKWEQDKLHLYVSNGASSIPKLIESCAEISTSVDNVSYSRPTLDDVFIQYTGGSIESGATDTEDKWWEKWAGKGGGGKWAKQWQENTDPSESGESDTSNEEQTWSKEEVENWHANKQWSAEESQQWENNKQWSKEEAAVWHESQKETSNNEQMNSENKTDSDQNKNHWPEDNDGDWNTKDKPEWDRSSSDTWPDGSKK